MLAHHLKLNLDKPELLFLPRQTSPIYNLSINIEKSVVSQVQTARNLGVTLDDQPFFVANIAATTPSCRFILRNIRSICLFLTEEQTQVLVQALVI